MDSAYRATRLKEVIRRLLKQRGNKYSDLAEHLGVSVATVKRILASEELSLTRLLEICAWLGTTLTELEAMTGVEDNAEAGYTEAQELFLSADTRFFDYLLKLEDGETPQSIAATYGLSPASTDLYLRRLEQHGLIRVSRGGRVTPTGRERNWRPFGPLTRVHHERLLTRFFGYIQGRAKARIMAPDSSWPISCHLRAGSMSKKNYDAFHADVGKALRRCEETAVVEEKLAGKRKLGKSVLALCYTWLEPGETLSEIEDVFGPLTNL